MSYGGRGKKCDALIRQLRKKSLIDERDARPQRRKGGGSWCTKAKTIGEWNEHCKRARLRECRKERRKFEATREEREYQAWRYMDEARSLMYKVREICGSDPSHWTPESITMQAEARSLTLKARVLLSEPALPVSQGEPSSYSYTEKAEAYLKQAGYCERYSPETAEYLREQAELMKAKAQERADEERRLASRWKFREMKSRPRRGGSVAGPHASWRSWYEETDGTTYRCWQVRDWYSWGCCPPHEPLRPKRKAQYTARYVPQEYYPAYYEIQMPIYRSPYVQAVPYEHAARCVENATREENFMGGVSYSMVNPLDTLKLISAGSIFGEPMYYHEGDNEAPENLDSLYGIGWADDYNMKYYDLSMREGEYFRKMAEEFRLLTASQVMEKVIDDALTFDFEGTLKWAVDLRTRFLMRLNPQVIIVRAAVHPERLNFTRRNPGKFQEIAQKVMTRGDDVIHQMEYWLGWKGSKNGLPAILKRSWAKRIGSMDAYSMSKYAHAGTGLVDVVRMCHAKSPLVNTLMRTGKVPMPEGEDTWERLRASGMKWQEILRKIRMPHMALLRNLRGIFDEVEDPEILDDALELLKRGVKGGKQFPFRYYTAWKIFEDEKSSWLWEAVERFFPWHLRVQAALEECINLSCGNLPEIPGRCAFLTDNSGSAWGAHTSEHGSTSMAEIGNLSSVIGAMRAEKGTVYTFGDQLRAVPVIRDAGVLEQARLVNSMGLECGMSIESGLYAFFRDAVMQHQHWDSVFIYSDMQAGSSMKYGINPENFRKMGALMRNGRSIDINGLVKEYRQSVNPKLNVVCIQTSGYTNTVMPEYGYRSSILCGWTGKELVFADEVRRLWDYMEEREGIYLLEPDQEMINLFGF